MALAGGIGALVVGIIGFGTSLIVLPTLAILFPTLFAPEIALPSCISRLAAPRLM